MENGVMDVIFIPIVILAVIGFIIYGIWASRKRRQELATLAHRLGMSFSPSKDYGMDYVYGFLEAFKQGRNRYAYNIIDGGYRDRDFKIFDYHYQTGSGKHTHDHYISFIIMTLEEVFPELKISREGILSKIGQALGFDDIDFESHEFSRNFCVRSKDKKFAYDACNAQMIEYLLRNRDVNIEIEHNVIAMAFNPLIDPAKIEYNLDRLIEIRSLMPDYLFNS